MTGRKQEERQRVAMLGKTLRSGVATPTDTYITDDIPLLLTRLSQIAPTPSQARDNAGIAPPRRGEHNDRREASS